MLRKIDGWVLSKIEKCCHKFQEYTGYTNYWLISKISLLVLIFVACSVIKFLLSHVNDHVLISPAWPTAYGGLLDSIFIIYLARWVFHWENEEVKAFDRIQKGLANPEKASTFHFGLRTAILVLLSIDIVTCIVPSPTYSTMTFIVGKLIFLQIELMACDPLPPCQGKIREKLATLFMKPAFTKVMD
jgi:hypothetical protein